MTTPGPETPALVLPFLPVTSRGGPYDDDAYTAGFEMGMLHSQLGSPAVAPWGTLLVTLHTGNRAQADLIAMHHGWHVVRVEDLPGGCWSQMTIQRSTGVIPTPTTP